MIFGEQRNVVVAVSPKLVDELKQRQLLMERDTQRKTRGGMTTFSEQAAYELEGIRKSGEEITREILNIKDTPVKKFMINGVEMDFVPYEYFKKLHIYASILRKKKDQQQINVDVSKLKGLKKNEIKVFW